MYAYKRMCTYSVEHGTHLAKRSMRYPGVVGSGLNGGPIT